MVGWLDLLGLKGGLTTETLPGRGREYGIRARTAAVRLRFGKLLRISRRTEAEGGIKSGLLGFVSI
jgi:hypothetical protein